MRYSINLGGTEFLLDAKTVQELLIDALYRQGEITEFQRRRATALLRKQDGEREKP